MLVLHGAREQLLKQRTATINALRSHLAEFGVVAAQRQIGLRELLVVVADDEDRRIPPLARELLVSLVSHLRDLERRTAALDRRLVEATRDGAAWRRWHPAGVWAGCPSMVCSSGGCVISQSIAFGILVDP